jgi:hypothetical protein
MSSLALRSFWLPATELLLLLIPPTEVEAMMMMTVATMILLIQLVLLGPALKDHPVPPVLPEMAKAHQVEEEVVVEEVAAMVMVVWQALLAGHRLRIPTSVFLFRLLPCSGMPSTSGIGILQLLVLRSRISGTQTPLTGLIQPN